MEEANNTTKETGVHLTALRTSIRIYNINQMSVAYNRLSAVTATLTD